MIDSDLVVNVLLVLGICTTLAVSFRVLVDAFVGTDENMLLSQREYDRKMLSGEPVRKAVNTDNRPIFNTQAYTLLRSPAILSPTGDSSEEPGFVVTG